MYQIIAPCTSGSLGVGELTDIMFAYLVCVYVVIEPVYPEYTSIVYMYIIRSYSIPDMCNIIHPEYTEHLKTWNAFYHKIVF